MYSYPHFSNLCMIWISILSLDASNYNINFGNKLKFWRKKKQIQIYLLLLVLSFILWVLHLTKLTYLNLNLFALKSIYSIIFIWLMILRKKLFQFNEEYKTKFLISLNHNISFKKDILELIYLQCLLFI